MAWKRVKSSRQNTWNIQSKVCRIIRWQRHRRKMGKVEWGGDSVGRWPLPYFLWCLAPWQAYQKQTAYSQLTTKQKAQILLNQLSGGRQEASGSLWIFQTDPRLVPLRLPPWFHLQLQTRSREILIALYKLPQILSNNPQHWKLQSPEFHIGVALDAKLCPTLMTPWTVAC